MRLSEYMDNDEFAEFYSLHISFVKRTAYYILRDERDALDVADLTMWYAFCNPEKFRCMPFASVEAYLGCVARARSLDLIRHRCRNRCIDIAYITDTPYEVSDESVERLVEIGDFRDIVERCIRSMSDIYRDTFILKVSKGMTLKEVAESLDIPLETAKSRWRRGLAIIEKSVRASGFNSL